MEWLEVSLSPFDLTALEGFRACCVQVITCSYVVYKAMAVCIGEGYTLAFNKFDPARENMAEVVWLFYL